MDIFILKKMASMKALIWRLNAQESVSKFCFCAVYQAIFHCTCWLFLSVFDWAFSYFGLKDLATPVCSQQVWIGRVRWWNASLSLPTLLHSHIEIQLCVGSPSFKEALNAAGSECQNAKMIECQNVGVTQYCQMYWVDIELTPATINSAFDAAVFFVVASKE